MNKCYELLEWALLQGKLLADEEGSTFGVEGEVVTPYREESMQFSKLSRRASSRDPGTLIARKATSLNARFAQREDGRRCRGALPRASGAGWPRSSARRWKTSSFKSWS